MRNIIITILSVHLFILNSCGQTVLDSCSKKTEDYEACLLNKYKDKEIRFYDLIRKSKNGIIKLHYNREIVYDEQNAKYSLTKGDFIICQYEYPYFKPKGIMQGLAHGMFIKIINKDSVIKGNKFTFPNKNIEIKFYFTNIDKQMKEGSWDYCNGEIKIIDFSEKRYLEVDLKSLNCYYARSETEDKKKEIYPFLGQTKFKY